jgi:hypothetical protein
MLTVELKAQFVSLAARLSPENLSCDGELSRSKVAARRKAIIKEWTALEKQAGRRVSEDETWGWWEEVRNWQDEQARRELAAQPQYPNMECSKPGVYRRRAANGRSAFYVWTPSHHRGDGYEAYCELAHIMGRGEKLGRFDSMEAAIAAAEAFLRTVDRDALRAALPRYRPENIERELALLPADMYKAVVG